MRPLYTKEQFEAAKSIDNLPCECYQCGKLFTKQKRAINKVLRGILYHDGKYCSQRCKGKALKTIKKINCTNCNTIFERAPNQIKKSKNHFCSHSCAATFSNIHKITGTRRSKLENFLEQQLISLYPKLEMHFNKKDTINSELDIYIPSLQLAFELNGIYHYEPIHGSDKLGQIQNNDQRKFQACAEKNISLCIIDTSRQKYFKESTSQEFLSIITEIINNKSKNTY